jgi:hypothetical protein
MSPELITFLIITSALALAVVVLTIKLRAAKAKELTVRTTQPATFVPVENIAAEALVLGPPESPLIEITPSATRLAGTPLPASSALKTALQPVLQRAPELLSQGTRMAEQGYRVVFSPEVTRALRAGAAELLPSGEKFLPVARDAAKGGKFVEIGRVAKSGGIKLASVAAASWQVLSIVTAQHFLNEINARLAGIEDGIKSIQHWLEDDERAQLTAAAGYLREIHAAIKRGELNSNEIQAIYNQLETLEVSARRIGDLAKATAQRRIAELRNLDIKDWMDRSGSAARAEEWLQSSKSVIDLLFLAQAMRVLACQVKSLLPGDRQRISERLAEVKQEAEAATALFDSAREVFLQKVNELRKRDDNPLAMWGILDADHRNELENKFAIVRKTIGDSASDFDKQTRSMTEISNRLDTLANEGMTLDIRIDKQGEMRVFQASV